MRFALNHILAPKLSLEAFFACAGALGVTEVEIRNDLPDIVGTVAPREVRAAAEKAGVSIISINALYPFNVWSGEISSRAEKLADYARACGAKGLVMCPLNEGKAIAGDDLVAAIKGIKPILQARGLVGYVEPLGFPVSSLRTKKEAIEAITAADGADVYRLVHDTFHHHLAGETTFYPEWTGLVHISGVKDPAVAVEDMLDAHRVLVDADDRLGNLSQIRALIAAGYSGPFSFEPFAAEIHELEDPKAAAKKSMDFVSAAL
jgi:2-keto-myo-inositol isomerase